MSLGKSVGACVRRPRPPPSVLSPPGGSFALALLRLLSTLCTLTEFVERPKYKIEVTFDNFQSLLLDGRL